VQGNQVITIGQLAARTGLSVSAIRYYERFGLVQSERSSGGQRRFIRADIRRLSFVMVAQRLGYSIREIKGILAQLPSSHSPTKAEWSKIARRLRADLEVRAAILRRLSANLDGCIGCGCLSLQTCKLLNEGDKARTLGTGARYLLSDVKPD
jgi:MerR family redox-sensitive transcriptional activator SoxR